MNFSRSDFSRSDFYSDFDDFDEFDEFDEFDDQSVVQLLLGVGCMEVENLEMVQCCSPQFFIVLNIITRHEKNKFS